MGVYVSVSRQKNGHKALDYVNDKAVNMRVCSPITTKIQCRQDACSSQVGVYLQSSIKADYQQWFIIRLERQRISLYNVLEGESMGL